MAQRKKYVGDAAIGRAIKSLGGKIANINDTVQDIAVSIVEHAAGAGNGDVSRALDLCKTVARYRTLNVAFLVGWFRHFGRANVNLRADDGAGKVTLIKPDQKGYRPFDVDGARVNNWYDAMVEGRRALWYAGPEPAEYQPLTIGDLAARMHGFVERTTKMLDDTKEVAGKEVPVVTLTDEDKRQVQHAMAFIDRIANTLARHEDVAKLEAERQKALEEAKADEDVIAVIEPKEKMVA